jgi:hypothetical protein
MSCNQVPNCGIEVYPVRLPQLSLYPDLNPSMISSSTIAMMSLAANAVIEDVLLRGSQGMRTTPRTEVGLVAAVVLGGINGIAAAWASILSGSKLSLNLIGVFCHAAPLVRFRPAGSRQQTCELADLLIVVDFLQGGGTARFATLI